MRLLAMIAAAALALSLALGGAAPIGRLLLAAGLPGLAARVLDDPQWRGVALYRAGNFDAAVAAFDDARDFYNLGNAETRRGRHAAALEAFDVAGSQGDPDAHANFDVVAAYYGGLGVDPDAYLLMPRRGQGPKAESFVARGNALAAGTGSEATNTNTMLGLAALDSRGQLGVRRVFDDKFIIADERWLENLADVPGEYMSARIAAEHKRRVKAGLSPPKAEDPR